MKPASFQLSDNSADRPSGHCHRRPTYLELEAHQFGDLQCEAPKIAKLVNITPITMVYGTYNYSNLDVENVNGEW